MPLGIFLGVILLIPKKGFSPSSEVIHLPRNKGFSPYFWEFYIFLESKLCLLSRVIHLFLEM
jgi:hypothetical protein